MTAAAMLASAQAEGVAVRLDNGKLKAEGPTQALDRWLPELRAHKPELLALLTVPPLTAKDRADIREAIEERAAIREFDGGAPRADALREAAAEVAVYRYRLSDKPELWRVLIAPGCDLAEATRAVRNVFGPERVLDVRRNAPC